MTYEEFCTMFVRVEYDKVNITGRSTHSIKGIVAQGCDGLKFVLLFVIVLLCARIGSDGVSLKHISDVPWI
jgi:hypothetical protein